MYVTLLILLLLSAAPANAQQTVSSASITGIVFDPSGAVVRSARVHLRNQETGHVVERITDEAGRYRFVSVPVGSYELFATAPGFSTTSVALQLRVADAVDMPIRLAAAQLTEAVMVTAEAPAVETRRTEVAERITPGQIDTLPLNGRNYLDLALLVPNVSRTNTRSNERFAETSAVPGTGISIAGQRNIGNTFIVDGLSANDDAADLAGTYFGEEVIREFQVITSGGRAEFGRASSGAINIVTQSGTNTWRGRGYGFFRNDRLDATNALATRKDPLSQGQYGLTSGGPLAKDRTFWFANVERTDQNKNGVVIIPSGDVEAIDAALQGFGFRGPRPATGEFRTGYESTNIFGRVDHGAGSSRLQLRYSLYDVASENARGVGGLNAVTRGTALADRDSAVAATWQTASSGSLVNDLRAQWTTSRLAAPPNDLVGPAVAVSGIANFGTSTSSPTRRDLRALQLADTLTMVRGSHFLKTGIDVLANRATIDFPGALQGSYTFTTLANLQRGVYQQFQQAFGEPSFTQSNPNAGVFVQDEWNVHPNLVVNGGVRYDLQWLPTSIGLDTNNVSPRLGVAWSPGDRRTVVRASGGVYFDRIPLRAVSNALQRDGVKYKVAILSFGQVGAPVFPAVLPSFPAGIVTAITTIDPDIQNGRTEQASVQVERAIGRTFALTVGYSHLRGHDIIMQRNVNVPTLAASEATARGIPNLGRPNPEFGNISRYESIGDSWFDGLTMALNTQRTTWGNLRVSYTLSRALDTAGNAFFSSPQDNFDIAAEKGPSDNDQRHRLVVSGDLGDRGTLRRLLHGIQIGYVVSYATGVPFNFVSGSDLNNDTNNNDRPAGVSRNSGRQPSTSTVDARVGRSFSINARQRIDVMIEAFNLLNHVNILGLDNTFGTGTLPRATFGRPTLAGDPRQMQLGVRWSF